MFDLNNRFVFLFKNCYHHFVHIITSSDMTILEPAFTTTKKKKEKKEKKEEDKLRLTLFILGIEILCIYNPVKFTNVSGRFDKHCYPFQHLEVTGDCY